MELLLVMLSGAFGIVGLVVGHWLGRDQARANRLRSLYADVLHAAIRLTPLSLQYRVGPEDMRPSDDELNMLRARLSVESAEDEDEVMQALSGVMIFSSVYAGEYAHHKEDPSAVPIDELRKEEKRVRDNMDQLQQTVRRRLAAAERPFPFFSRPRRRKPAPK
jgi:hypothetical protein